MDRKYKLLGILQSYAPGAPEQQRCTTIYNQMIDDGLSNAKIELNLVVTIVDGLRHGNWPWTKYEQHVCDEYCQMCEERPGL